MNKAAIACSALSIALLSACGSGSGDAPLPENSNTPAAETANADSNSTSENTKISYVETYLRPMRGFEEPLPAVLEERDKFVSTNLALALQRLSESDGNAVHFPVDQIAAYNQLAISAQGETQAQLKAIYDAPNISDDLFHQTHDLWLSRIVSQISKVGARRTESWAQISYKFNSDYLDAQALNYTPALWATDFANFPADASQTISYWVNVQTGVIVPDPDADPDADPYADIDPDNHGDNLTATISAESRIVNGQYLVSAPEWTREIDVENVAQTRFKADNGFVYEVPALRFQGEFKHVSTEQYNAILLPLNNNQQISTMHLLVLMPSSGEFETIKAQVTPSFWNTLLASAEDELMTVTIPEFALTAEINNLAPTLAAQEANADFSPVNHIGHLYNTLFSQIGEMVVSREGLNSSAITMTQLSAKQSEPTTAWADGFAPLTSPGLVNPPAVTPNISVNALDTINNCYDQGAAEATPFMFALVESNSAAVLNIGQFVTPQDNSQTPLHIACGG
ncbi:serpin family protein [Pseudomonadota bacterium]